MGLAQTAHTKIDIAQPDGCNPIAEAILTGASEINPVKPPPQAHSLGIGSPGDGVFVIEAVRGRGGTAASVSDKEIFAGIDLLASTEGLLTEPAGGTTVAVVKKLAAEGRLDPDETIVAIVTGNGLKDPLRPRPPSRGRRRCNATPRRCAPWSRASSARPVWRRPASNCTRNGRAHSSAGKANRIAATIRPMRLTAPSSARSRRLCATSGAQLRW